MHSVFALTKALANSPKGTVCLMLIRRLTHAAAKPSIQLAAGVTTFTNMANSVHPRNIQWLALST